MSKRSLPTVILVSSAILAVTPASWARASETGAAVTIPASASAPMEETLTLDRAIGIAWANYGSIATARESVTAARERVRQARTGTLPMVSGDVSYAVSGSGGRVGTGFGTAQSDTGVQPRVSMDYNVYDGGVTRAAVRQALANVTGSEASLASARNNVAYTVAQSFYSQLRAERILTLRKEQESLAEEQLKSVEARIEAEDAAAADRALPLSELRNRQVDRVQAQNDIAIAANALRNVMGLAAGPPLKLAAVAAPADDLPKLPELIETALRERPEVVQAQARVKSAQAAVDVARINRRPRVDTTVGYSFTPESDSKRSGWDAGASVSMPIFDFGLSLSRQREAEADVRSANEELQQTARDVTADVTEAYNSLLNARERVSASGLAVDAARVNLDAATERYRLGASGSSVLTLITAQVQYATASNSSIEADYDRMIARAQLDRALGLRK